MPFMIDEKRLEQLAMYINEMPTKFGFPLAVLLNQWVAQSQQPAPDASPVEPVEEPAEQ